MEIIKYIHFFILKMWLKIFLKDFIYFFLERRREGEKHQCVVTSCMLLTIDLAHNPGMCPHWNQTGDPLVCRPMLNPLSHTSQSLKS